MQVDIRKYIIADKDPCVAAFKSNVPLYFTESEIPDFENFLDKYISLANDPKSKTYYYVILLDNNIVGCGGFGKKENAENLTLVWGLIHKDFHKKELGKKLLLFRIGQI